VKFLETKKNKLYGQTGLSDKTKKEISEMISFFELEKYILL
jgi:hypothetical protein